MGDSPSSVLTQPPPAVPVAPGPTRWRRRSVAALLVLAVVAGAVWFWASASTVRSGSVTGPASGLQVLEDGIDQTKWLQTSEDAAVYFTVRNDGRLPVVLGVTPGEDESGWAGPYLRVGLLPFSWREPNILGWPATPALSSTITVQPGDEALVVFRVLYPSRCLQQDPLSRNASYMVNDSVRLTASTLGRTTEAPVPLPYPIYTPSRVNVGCTVEDFAALTARYPLEQ